MTALLRMHEAYSLSEPGDKDILVALAGIAFCIGAVVSAHMPVLRVSSAPVRHPCARARAPPVRTRHRQPSAVPNPMGLSLTHPPRRLLAKPSVGAHAVGLLL